MNEKEAIEYIEQFIGIKKEYQCKPIKVKTLNNTRKAIETVLNLLKKKDKIIDEMAMSLYDYANLEVVINCPAEYDQNYDLSKCRMNLANRNCISCIKQYFERKVKQ